MYKVHAVLGKGPEVSSNWEAGLTQRGHGWRHSHFLQNGHHFLSLQKLLFGAVVMGGLFPFKTPLSKAIPMPHVQVCTYPGRHTHMVTRDALGGQRKRWEVIDERPGAVSRLPGQDSLFVETLWNQGPVPTSASLSACGGRRRTLHTFLSHSPHKTGTPPEPGAHQLARLATSEPRGLPSGSSALGSWSIFL